ncbi:MAG: chromosome partitioning protein ParB, partial [Alphaproteobacteria bacterium]
MAAVPISFLLKPIQVNVGNILPSRGAPTNLLTSRKYKQIRASIQQIDLIEPLSVSPVDKKTGQHGLLDGHIRWTVLKELGYTEAPCLIATDDESFTYNNRVNRLSSIQEHVMLRRAVDRGVSAERLANALAINVAQIETRLKLLDGICAEAAELLKDRTASVEVFNSLRKMKPTRQIECAELMISANNVSSVYARAMLSATPPD